jgi:murein DD-endopeptidase MepM/ murein hydrolase activator NlpD
MSLKRPLARAASILPILCALMGGLIGLPSLSAEALYYSLQKGETVFAVAKRYGVPVEAIIAVNSIGDPSKIKTGQKLLIPQIHKVLAGETLYGIAKASGIGVDELRALNKLSAQALIKPGDRLYLPASAGSSSPAPLAGEAAAPAGEAGQPPPGPANPPALRLSSKQVDKSLTWPCPGDAVYLAGKLAGVMIRPQAGEAEKALAAGTVVFAGPFRGYGEVVIVQSRTGYLYLYGGNESLNVKVGETVRSGQELGNVGIDPKDGLPAAYFSVSKKNGEAIDPALAPRD